MIQYGGVEGCLSSRRVSDEYTRFHLVFSMRVFRGFLRPIGCAVIKFAVDFTLLAYLAFVFTLFL